MSRPARLAVFAIGGVGLAVLLGFAISRMPAFGFALSGDLFDMFVFFELMGAAAYALTALKIEDAESVQGGLSFAVVNSLGAYLCLTGIALLYARTGQLGLPQLGRALAGHAADPLVLAAFTLVATGWLVKAAAVPFHFWLADAHAVAPAPVCVLFSGVMAPLGLYGLGRVYWVVFHGVLPDSSVRRMLLVLGVGAAVLGAAMCVTQRHIKRLLAYSTIAHIGLLLIGLAALTSGGVAGFAVYLAGHATVKGALFLLAGLLLGRYGSVDELSLYGRAKRYRAAGVAFVLGALALAGLPPFGTALGKSVVDDAGHAPWLTVLTVAVSAVTGGAALRVALRVHFAVGPRLDPDTAGDRVTGQDEQPDTRPPHGTTPPTMAAAIALLLAAGLGIGVFPQVRTMIAQAAAAFTDQHGYWDAALLGVAGRPAGMPDLRDPGRPRTRRSPHRAGVGTPRISGRRTVRVVLVVEGVVLIGWGVWGLVAALTEHHAGVSGPTTFSMPRSRSSAWRCCCGPRYAACPDSAGCRGATTPADSGADRRVTAQIGKTAVVQAVGEVE
ncbi:MAG TPA: complex I subunit 5 family protein [Pseudonocardiaceae bacterium]|nr:complex I subunit 5 family protein [Pseudonocardiaceae bacterium]